MRSKRRLAPLCAMTAGDNARPFAQAKLALLAAALLNPAPARAVEPPAAPPDQTAAALDARAAAIQALRETGGFVIPNVEKLRAAGGKDLLNPKHEFIQADFSPDGKNVDEALAKLELFPELQRVNLSGTSVTESGLVRVGRLTNLTELNLDSTPTDAAWRRCASCGASICDKRESPTRSSRIFAVAVLSSSGRCKTHGGPWQPTAPRSQFKLARDQDLGMGDNMMLSDDDAEKGVGFRSEDEVEIRSKAVKRSWFCPGAGFALAGYGKCAIATFVAGPSSRTRIRSLASGPKSSQQYRAFESAAHKDTATAADAAIAPAKNHRAFFTAFPPPRKGELFDVPSISLTGGPRF